MKIPFLPQLRWLKKFVAHPATSDLKMDDLFRQAGSCEQQPHRWNDGDPLSAARNAHYTNSTSEMKEGLSSDFNFLEGDVWLEGAARQIAILDLVREPIMAHDPDEVNGLSLSEWLDVGKRSGKGLKIDIKQSAAIPKIISLVRDKQIPQERLIFNADVAFGPGIKKDLKFRALDVITDFTSDLEEMKQIRAAFPRATMGIGLYTKTQPKGTYYSREQLSEVSNFAREVGGPITFPLRAEFVDRQVIETLKPYGTISIWNDPKSFAPDDLAAAERKFREMGVDGMIDLRGKHQPKKSPIYDSDLWPPRIPQDFEGQATQSTAILLT